MTAKCLECGYEMKTWQEVTTFISGIISRSLNRIADLKKLKEILFGNTIFGACAGPFNEMKIKCPKCKSSESWEDL